MHLFGVAPPSSFGVLFVVSAIILCETESTETTLSGDRFENNAVSFGTAIIHPSSLAVREVVIARVR
jgi:hypothetical protein